MVWRNLDFHSPLISGFHAKENMYPCLYDAASSRIRPAHLPSVLYPEQEKHENKRGERENNKCEKDSDSSIIFMNSTFRLAPYSQD